MFDPLSITFLTLFSPKSSQGFKNIKTSLWPRIVETVRKQKNDIILWAR
jgi:hypothetical protein